MTTQEFLSAQVANDTHAAVHRSLHRLLDILKPDLETSLKIGDSLCLTEGGARIVERVASLASYNLRYNTRCLRSWDSLASTCPNQT